MRFYRLRLLFLLLLVLALPQPGYAFDGDAALRAVGLLLLSVLAGFLAFIALLLATSKLMQQLAQPEAADPHQRQAAGWRIAGLTLPATVVAWGLLTWLTYGPSHSWYYPAVPLTLLVGAAACLLLWWRHRPTAAKSLLLGLLVAGAGATVGHSLWRQPRPAVVPPGLLGNPVFREASFPGAAQAIDTSYVYTYTDQMPGFRGTGTALKKLVQQELRYPALARDNGLAGLVQVTFVVRPTGGLAASHVTQSLSPECDTEALRVLRKLAPHFSPGSQSGRLVPVQLTLSFWFGPLPIEPQ